jgi:hypothetical protein
MLQTNIKKRTERRVDMSTTLYHLSTDRYWGSLIHIFKNHPKLQGYLTTKYFDLDAMDINIKALKAVSRPWSSSEKFMLNLALHLFNENNKLPGGLGDFDCLDSNNRKIAFEAIKIRFGS